MKYFDRKLFVVQHVLVKYLPPGYEYKVNNGESYWSKSPISKIIYKRAIGHIYEILRTITSDKYDMVNFIPERIQQSISDESLREENQSFLIDWIVQCDREFTQRIHRWKSAASQVIPYITWNKLNCFNTVDPNIFPAKVKILVLDSKIIRITPENIPWGQMVFEFPEAKINGIETGSYEGWLMWTEVEQVDDGFEFGFLFNIDGHSTLSIETIMSDNDWVEFKVRTKLPNIIINNYDYAYGLYETGCQSTKIFLESCVALLKKSKDLGVLYLNENEKTMLYIAKFYECFSSAVNPEITDANPIDTIKLEQFIGNQYGFEQTCNTFIEVGDEELSKVTASLKRLDSNKAISKEAIECKRLMRVMEDRDNSPQGRLLYKNLCSLMMEAASLYGREWNGRSDFVNVRNEVIKQIEPEIFNMGFTGEFPHYRRISMDHGEYITFFCISHENSYLPDMYVNDNKYVKMSIFAGRAPLTGSVSNFFLSGLPFEDSNAWDCTWEKNKCISACIGPSDVDGWFNHRKYTKKNKIYRMLKSFMNFS